MCNLLILDPVWVSSIAATIAAIAAVVYAYFTGKLIKEMREDRKLAYRPIIKAIYETGTLPNTLCYTFKNLGKGPALNIKIEYKDGEIQWRSKKILAIGSGEEFTESIDVKGKNIKLGSEIFLDIEYTDILGKAYKEKVPVTPKSQARDT
jgi:hypothetical protein